MITTTLEFNIIPAVAAAIPGIVQSRVELAANLLRERMMVAIESRAHGIGPDTGALIESLFIQTPFGSDYDARLKAAASAYLGNPSRWAELVRKHVTPSAYTAAHFNERVAAEEPLEVTEGEAVAAVATMLAYGSFWEFGHFNVLTEQYEHRPWMGPEADFFEAREWEMCFANLLEGVAL